MPNTKSPKNKTTAPMKLLPTKLGKKIKHQFHRSLNLFHHVTLPTHQSAAPDTLPIVAASTVLPSLLFPAIDVVHGYNPPPLTLPASSRSGYSKDSFTKSIQRIRDVDLHSEGSSSSTLEPSDHSSQSSITFTEEMTDNAQEAMVFAVPSAGLAEEVQEPSVHEPAESFPTESPENGTKSPQEPMFTSPPAVFVEPEVPDPFLIDDEDDDPISDDEVNPAPSSMGVSESQQTITPADEIALTVPTAPFPSDSPHPASLLSPNLNKDVPPPPSSNSGSDEEETPDLYLPGLIIPTMFLPIPNTDPLTTLLTKYIYPPEKRPVRDLTGDWQGREFHTLVMTNSWRALARMARDRIVTSDPEDLTLVLGLWYLRLACLARLRLFNQTSSECTNLFVVLNAIEPPEARSWVFDRVLPFELEVMQARLKYWAGDHMAYLDALNALLKKCRSKARSAKSDTVMVSMWKERGARICLIIASQLMEMKEFAAAAGLLEPLCEQGDGVSTSALRSSIARVYLQSGNIQMASKHFRAVDADPTADQDMKDMNSALLASAEGDWTEASDCLYAIVEKDAKNYAAVNNLSVALLSQGKLKEGIDVLETALKSSPSSVVVAEPFLFNLSTLYELRSATAVENKRNLLVEVAKWSGDGLKAACLKMPSS